MTNEEGAKLAFVDRILDSTDMPPGFRRLSLKGTYPNTQFDFLGYTFRARTVKNSKRDSLFVSFTPAVSKQAVTVMRLRTRKLNYRNRMELSLADIARLHNPILRGWLAYYGKFSRSAMYPVLRHFNKTLVAWAMRKYKRLKGHKIRAKPVSRANRRNRAVSLRTLATWDGRCVRLMGAV